MNELKEIISNWADHQVLAIAFVIFTVQTYMYFLLFMVIFHDKNPNFHDKNYTKGDRFTLTSNAGLIAL